MNKKITIQTFLIFTLIVFNSLDFSNAQVSTFISDVKTSSPRENQPLTFNFSLFQTSSIAKIVMYYKSVDDVEFNNVELLVEGNRASVTIPENLISAPEFQYYLNVVTTDGGMETFPISYSVDAVPLKIMIEAKSEKDREIIFLSPEPESNVPIDEFFISISLLRADDDVNKSATKIFLSNNDITQYALFADELILIAPMNLPFNVVSGINSIRVDLYKNDNSLHHSINIEFNLLRADQVLLSSSGIKFNGNVRGESRNENINKVSTWYNNIGLNFNSNYSDWNFFANAFITSDEKPDRQPNNRYAFSIQSSWLDLRYGDNFPTFPNLILSGRRVRGFSGALNLGFFNLQAAFGETNRAINGELLATGDSPFDPNLIAAGGNIIAVDPLRYGGKTFAAVDGAFFKRDIVAVRPSFGSGESFQLGFTYLKSKDDILSSEFGTRPKENLVVGTDLFFGFDERRIQFTSQAAMSASNSNIAPGSFTDDQIDSLFGSGNPLGGDPSDIKNLRDLLEQFITVNQFIKPLNPEELPTLASEANLTFNYFNNFLKLTYLYRGSDYESFGQTYLRTDVAGFNISDNLRLFDNRLFLSVLYEDLKDNLQKSKPATTNYRTLSGTVAFYPRANFPNISFTYSRFTNKNNIELTDVRLSSFAIDDFTDRISTSLSYDFRGERVIRTSLSFSISDRKDNSLNKNDIKNFATSFSANTSVTKQISAFASVSINQTSMPNRDFNFVNIILMSKWQIIEEELTLNATLSPSFGDLNRQTLDLYAEYFVMRNLSIQLIARYFKYGENNDTVFGLSTQFALN